MYFWLPQLSSDVEQRIDLKERTVIKNKHDTVYVGI
jgi:hypothetical protein